MSATTKPEQTLAEELRENCPVHRSGGNTDEHDDAPDIYCRAAAELDRLRGECERKDAALRTLMARGKLWLDAIGPCEHDVNICSCEDIAALEKAEAALSPKEQT